MNAENASNKENSILVEREQIQGTPFYVVVSEDKWFISFAEFRVSDEYPREEIHESAAFIAAIRAREILQEQQWWIVMRLAGIMHEKITLAAINSIPVEEQNMGPVIERNEQP